MLIIYSIIIVSAFSFFGIVVSGSYKSIRIKNEENRLFQTANVVADTYRANKEDQIFIRTMAKSYGRQANARILILDSQKKTVVDSHNSYIGKTVDNEEIRSSLASRPKSGIYELQGKEVLQLSVPIMAHSANETKIEGAVLISASLEAISQDLKDLKNTLLKVSASALLIALIFTVMAANSIAKPLSSLTNAVEKVSSGYLGYKVEDRESGEIGKLIESFNEMSGKLKQIENNRKSFINSISHELKTPITAIRALIESLSLGNSSLEIYKEYLEDINDEAKRMGQLVDYLLSSIKLEDISLDLKEEDLAEIIEDAFKLIKPYAEKNGVDVAVNGITSVRTICDRNKVKEALLNLLDNSVKYKDPYKKQNNITISLVKNKNEACLVIEDNGMGIREEYLSNIFNRGFRVLDAEIAANSRTEGYGIGLAIVKNIIEKHNWQIAADSNYGSGSKFTITISL
ncbi:sensor histidine kinase [Lutispora saccharofermentans]|uniref:histidine kinase n=1 Tax=Lutispora saccharofermentans TaxID=3024236 RepID=A0ABT1NHV5_9FIRM|nr:HAMP domain-containing sensor histidine kinase [Lutispora saccharofermentans]MCQ1530803.1 HAMP domain-containing histidine kinase [Lutispora saccharofermentans]